MLVDCEAYGHDRAIVKDVIEGSATPFHRSEAAKLLRDDVKVPENSNIKPAQLQLTRPEYEGINGKVFRKHIYHEQDREAKIAFRKEKKKLLNKGGATAMVSVEDALDNLDLGDT